MMFAVSVSARSPSKSQALDGHGRGGGMLWKMVCRQGLAAAPQRSAVSSPVHHGDRQSWADPRVQLRHGAAPQRNNPLRVISSESCGQPAGGLGAGFRYLWGPGVTIVKPIVYGNVARYFGKKREEDGHTHQWTVYVKPYRNEDMSAYVKKIQFKLHESYGNPLRVVTKPPYEITETGWGEFEIIIKIFFIDPNERPVTLYHLLKLFQSDTNAILGKKTVVSEFYDEMIFQDPTAMMQQLLTTSRQLTLGAYKHETEFADLEVKTREKLEAAKKKTSFEIAELKERLKASRETINCLKNEIRKLEEDDQSKDM
nr:YEATS domain-containing protein 4 [Zonotrichia albicollis]